MGYFPALFAEAARRMGYHPFPVPAANLSQAYRNPDGIVRPACAYCGFCERFGCMVGAKAQPTNTLMPVIARQKNVSVRTGANVRRVRYKDGKADRRHLCGCERGRGFSAGGHRGAGFVDLEQYAAAAALGDRAGVRSELRDEDRWGAT